VRSVLVFRRKRIIVPPWVGLEASAAETNWAGMQQEDSVGEVGAAGGWWWIRRAGLTMGVMVTGMVSEVVF